MVMQINHDETPTIEMVTFDIVKDSSFCLGQTFQFVIGDRKE